MISALRILTFIIGTVALVPSAHAGEPSCAGRPVPLSWSSDDGVARLRYAVGAGTPELSRPLGVTVRRRYGGRVRRRTLAWAGPNDVQASYRWRWRRRERRVVLVGRWLEDRSTQVATHVGDRLVPTPNPLDPAQVFIRRVPIYRYDYVRDVCARTLKVVVARG